MGQGLAGGVALGRAWSGGCGLVRRVRTAIDDKEDDVDEAATLRDWLRGIYEEHGRLTPELVRDAARPEDSPGRPHVFGLAPADAAEAHYLSRAHDLIRRVKVTVVERGTDAPRRIRVWHAIPGREARYEYEPLDALRSDPEKLAAARVEAVRRIAEAEGALADLDVVAAGTPGSASVAVAAGLVRRARRTVEAGG